MSQGWRTLAESSQLNALASAIIGVLLVGLSLLQGRSSPLVVPEIALLIGGVLLLGVGLLGVWQPERWAVHARNPWLGVLNAIAIVLLLAAIVLRTV